MNYSNVLYNGVEAITLPLSHSRLPIVVAYDSESEVVSTYDRTRIKREKLQTLVHLPHSIIIGDDNV